MICSHCNMEVPDNLDHCPYCGEKLEAPVSENSDTKSRGLTPLSSSSHLSAYYLLHYM